MLIFRSLQEKNCGMLEGAKEPNAAARIARA
jgi:hypothetical protein